MPNRITTATAGIPIKDLDTLRTRLMSPLGGGVETTGHGVVEGRSAVHQWSDPTAEGHATQVA